MAAGLLVLYVNTQAPKVPMYPSTQVPKHPSLKRASNADTGLSVDHRLRRDTGILGLPPVGSKDPAG